MKRIVPLASLLLLALSLAVPAGPADAAPRGRVTVALGSDTPTQDPHMHTARMGIIINQHIFDTLLARDTTTWKPVPHLAESVKSVNALTWELRLRKGVTFHNGEPFTAESVKFSFDRVLNPEQKSPLRGNFTWIKSVDVVDEHTVRIVTTKPYPLIQEILTFGNFGMVPPRYIKEKGDANFAKHPVGTGPFTFVEWRKGERTVLEANERYWKGAPAIKPLVFRVIPETATQIAELLSGGVDFIRAVPPDQIPAIKASGQARVTATKILRVAYLQMDGDADARREQPHGLRLRSGHQALRPRPRAGEEAAGGGWLPQRLRHRAQHLRGLHRQRGPGGAGGAGLPRQGGNPRQAAALRGRRAVPVELPRLQARRDHLRLVGLQLGVRLRRALLHPLPQGRAIHVQLVARD